MGACIQALLTCGFQDMGDVYVCRSAADLALMREMLTSLQRNPPGEALRQTPAVASTGGGGTRLVNGVIVPSAPAPVPVVAAASPASAGAAPAPKSSGGYCGGQAAPKSRSAFAFSSSSKREQAEKAQREALEEARRLQKD